MVKTFYAIIPTSEVLIRATQLIDSATREIIVTNSTSDTKGVQPNDEYYNTLTKKITEGITVKRFFYGNKSKYQLEKNSQIIYEHAGTEHEYQRAIIVDKEKALFRVANNYCYSENTDLIKALLNYVTAKI